MYVCVLVAALVYDFKNGSRLRKCGQQAKNQSFTKWNNVSIHSHRFFRLNALPTCAQYLEMVLRSRV